MFLFELAFAAMALFSWYGYLETLDYSSVNLYGEISYDAFRIPKLIFALVSTGAFICMLVADIVALIIEIKERCKQ